MRDYPAHREVKKRVARLEARDGRHGPARRLWREVARFDRRVSGPPLHLERLDDRPIPPAAGEIRLFTRIRNEHLRLPWLFDFYRGQGVDRFFVVDNGSDDGSRDYLLGRPDTHLYLTTNSYAVFGGGVRWLNHLLDRHGTRRLVPRPSMSTRSWPTRTPSGWASRRSPRISTGRAPRACSPSCSTCTPSTACTRSPTGRATTRSRTARTSTAPATSGATHPDFPFRMVAGGLVSRFLYDRKLDGVIPAQGAAGPLAGRSCATPAARTRCTRSRWRRRPACCCTSSSWPTSSTAPGSRPSASSTGRVPSATRSSTGGWQPHRPIDFRCELTERFTLDGPAGRARPDAHQRRRSTRWRPSQAPRAPARLAERMTMTPCTVASSCPAATRATCSGAASPASRRRRASRRRSWSWTTARPTGSPTGCGCAGPASSAAPAVRRRPCRHRRCDRGCRRGPGRGHSAPGRALATHPSRSAARPRGWRSTFRPGTHRKPDDAGRRGRICPGRRRTTPPSAESAR